MSDPVTDPDSDGRAPPAVFLGRQSYRRRRLMDAARILPLFGAMLFAVPLLWPVPDPTVPDAATVRMSDAILYVFGVWVALILAVALFGYAARGWSEGDRSPGPGPG